MQYALKEMYTYSYEKECVEELKWVRILRGDKLNHIFKEE